MDHWLGSLGTDGISWDINAALRRVKGVIFGDRSEDYITG